MMGFLMPCGKSVNYSKLFKELQGLFLSIRIVDNRESAEQVVDFFENFCQLPYLNISK